MSLPCFFFFLYTARYSLEHRSVLLSGRIVVSRPPALPPQPSFPLSPPILHPPPPLSPAFVGASRPFPCD